MEAPVDNESRWRPDEGVFWCQPVGATALLNLKTGRYHTLNASGSVVWNHIVRGDSIARIGGALVEELDSHYPVASAMSDVRDIVRELRRAKLITPDELSPRGPATRGPQTQSGRQERTETSRGSSNVRAPTHLGCLVALAAFHLAAKCIALRSLLHIADGAKSLANEPIPEAWIEQVNCRIAWSGAVYPFQADCLERSLVFLWFARRSGFPVDLRLGVGPFPFKAHAWIEYAGRPINDEPEYLTHFTAFPAIRL